MPTVKPIGGAYSYDLVFQPIGFQLNGASAPTVLRDGTNVATASGKMFTVARDSAGLYTVSLDSQTPWPEKPFIFAQVDQPAVPTTPVKAHYVKDSYSPTTRSFKVKVLTVAASPAASDGDAGDRISCLIVGSLSSVGTDPA